MIFDKKYITIEYIIKLIIGLLRYDMVSPEKSKQLNNIYKFFDYIKTKHDKFDILFKLFDVDDISYLKLYVCLLKIKDKHPLYNLDDIKQKIVDKFERKVERTTFIKIYKIISFCIKNIDNEKYVTSNINDEYNKLLKFIILWKSCNNLNNLYNKFYESDDAINNYEVTISNIFDDYDASIDDCDFLLDGEDAIDDAFDHVSINENEIRLSDLFREINFIQKTRIAIFVGESGFGKSMMLCHLACENLVEPKPDGKTYIVPYISFENSKEETLCRIFANLFEEQIDNVRLNMRNAELRKEYKRRYMELVDNNTKLYIVKLPPRKHNMLSLEVYLNRVLMKYKNAEIYTLYLDYIDKMLPNNFYSLNRPTHEKLDEISDEFKGLVEKYDCAGVTVSQIGRSGITKSRANEDWGASDMRGAIAKFENADIVALMKYDNTLDELGYICMSFDIDKHRYGRNNIIIDALYKPYFAKFYKVSDDSVNKNVIKPKSDNSEIDIDINIVDVKLDDINIDSDLENEKYEEEIKLKTTII